MLLVWNLFSLPNFASIYSSELKRIAIAPEQGVALQRNICLKCSDCSIWIANAVWVSVMHKVNFKLFFLNILMQGLLFTPEKKLTVFPTSSCKKGQLQFCSVVGFEDGIVRLSCSRFPNRVSRIIVSLWKNKWPERMRCDYETTKPAQRVIKSLLPREKLLWDW